METQISELIREVHEAAAALRASGEAIARGEGLSLTQWHLLDSIDDTATVARTARRMGISRQALQKVANGLVADGIIALEPNPDHKSSPLLRLTDRGRDAQKRIWARAQESHDDRFGHLDPAEIDATRRMLREITEVTYRAYP